MKKVVIFTLIAFASSVLFFSCSQSPEKKIAGTWKVEDVKLDSPKPVDPQQVADTKKSSQQISYELHEDKTAKIHAGTTILEGTWEYREAEKGVYMSFKGSFDTSLLGRYEDGKLINIATRTDLTITTIFAKEK
jgi:hypothetical protein